MYYRLIITICLIFYYNIAFADPLRPFDNNIPSATYVNQNNEPYMYVLKYAKPENVRNAISSILPDYMVRYEPDTGILIMYATPEIYKKILPILERLDKPPKKIILEVKVIELSTNTLSQLGVSWQWSSYPASSSSEWSGLVGVIKIDTNRGYNLNYNATIEAAQKTDNAKILAQPRVQTLNNHPAKILIGERLPVEVRSLYNGIYSSVVNYVDVGIKLEVTPKINDENTVTVFIKQEVSNNMTPVGFNPNIRTRETQTTIRVQRNETIVIGGLLQDEIRKKVNRIPFLSDIPVIGGLFKSENNDVKKTDLIICITPQFE